MKLKSFSSLLALAGFAAAGSHAQAAEVIVNSDIASSTVWTADNTYNLSTQIYVLPGATLTIEPGTRIASTPSANGSGSLAVTNGAQIFVNGTANNPVVFTSTNDNGTWREAANEWGNLTIMGDAYISNTSNGPVAGNVPTPSGSNIANMEGLVSPGNASLIQYGGSDDEYDAGSVTYASIRYAGRVVGLANELNGLSLGGLGRGTDISHIEIMNNVDDGIEIWGGTVNIKNFSIWNVGDDSFDVDQGWRGKAQFGLIVQGYSVDASQGSGVGDNMFEVDGAEDSDAQPVTTATLYNMTAIGQPLDGDGSTAWRDGARVQYRQSIFMDGGENVVRADGDDGDGSSGYGHNGTLDFASVWTTPFTSTSSVNAGGVNPADLYQAQSAGNASGQGFLAEITDSVFSRNFASGAYDNADLYGVTVAGGSNPAKANVVNDTDLPITLVTRGPQVTRGGKEMLPVISLDPTPANDALISEGTPPQDGFFSYTTYRGAFSPTGPNWLLGWTAADEFGFLVSDPNELASFDFDADAEGWVDAKTIPSITDGSSAFVASRGLQVTPDGASTAYITWTSPAVNVIPGTQIEVLWDISTDAPSQADSLAFRLRLNDSAFTGGGDKTVESVGSAAESPGPNGSTRYSQIYNVPASTTSITLSFDLFGFDPANDLSSSLYLDGVRVRQLN